MIETEKANKTVDEYFPLYAEYNRKMVTVSDPVASIKGIQKTGDYSMRVVLTEVDATAIYSLGVTIAPLHYYGETAFYAMAHCDEQLMRQTIEASLLDPATQSVICGWVDCESDHQFEANVKLIYKE